MSECMHAHSVMSNSLPPPGLQSSRLFCPWNFPGKNTGVGCISYFNKCNSDATQVKKKQKTCVTVSPNWKTEKGLLLPVCWIVKIRMNRPLPKWKRHLLFQMHCQRSYPLVTITQNHKKKMTIFQKTILTP